MNSLELMTLEDFNSDNVRKNAMSVIESHIQTELAPYLGDSVIKIDLNNNEESWVADVVIDSNRGLKASRRKNSSIQELVQQVIDDLKFQFEMVSSGAKNEIFLFDQQQEYDHYTETLSSYTTSADEKLKVLVIEDDPTARLILDKSLQSFGCQVELVSDPEVAIEKVTSKKYDLVILDWCLPYMTGHEFLKQADAKLSVKNTGNTSLKSIPLVICSSKRESEINLPLVSNFLFCQYWNKQLPFSTVISSIENAVTNARKYKTKVA